MTNVSFFFNFAYLKDMNKNKEFKLPVLTGKGISTYSNSPTWMFSTEDNHQAQANQESYSETEHNFMAAATESCSPKGRSMVGESKCGGAEGIILCSLPTSTGLNGWWKFKWLQESQRHPSDLQYRSYPHNLISFCERQWWDARKWTKPTFAKGMEKQKQVVK